MDRILDAIAFVIVVLGCAILIRVAVPSLRGLSCPPWKTLGAFLLRLIHVIWPIRKIKPSPDERAERLCRALALMFFIFVLFTLTYVIASPVRALVNFILRIAKLDVSNSDVTTFLWAPLIALFLWGVINLHFLGKTRP